MIERFCEAMELEAGLAAASVASYRRDCIGAAAVRQAGRGLRRRMCRRCWRGCWICSARRRPWRGCGCRCAVFFAWMVEERLRADDPTVLLEAVRHEKPLPRSLSEAEVERLLAAPDLATPAGLRDAAMLELLYACGLRVSELVGLPLSAVSRRKRCCAYAARATRCALCRWASRRRKW